MNIHPMEAEARCDGCGGHNVEASFKDPATLICKDCGARTYTEADSDDGCSR